MVPIGRVFVGEFMSSPQNRRSYRNGGARHFNADIFPDIAGTAVHLRRGTQQGYYATMKGLNSGRSPRHGHFSITCKTD
jgi:hypothetical protein